MGCCEVEADTFPTKKVLSEIQYSKKSYIKMLFFLVEAILGEVVIHILFRVYFYFFFGGGKG